MSTAMSSMSQSPTREGSVPFQIPSIESPCSTYFKIFGDLTRGRPPVVILHGGPGVGHEYLLPFAELWSQFELPVVFYDQIGCASSTHLPHTQSDKAFWQESLFITELDNLLDHLQLRDGPGFHLLGHSWGGRLAAAFAASNPRGLQRLVLASGLASTELAQKGRELQKQQLPPNIRDVIDEAEKNDELQSPAYKGAMDVFYRTFMCRANPFPPPELLAAFKNLASDRTVHNTMYGPSPMKITGSLQGWTCIPRLPNITAPTLVYNSEFDTSHDIATAPFFENIPRVRWITFPNAGHMCHLEEGSRHRVLRTVGSFLQSSPLSTPA